MLENWRSTNDYQFEFRQTTIAAKRLGNGVREFMDIQAKLINNALNNHNRSVRT